MTRRRGQTTILAILRVLVTASVLGVGLPAGASAHGPDPVLSSSLWAQEQRLTFRWRSGAEPPSAIKAAIRAAADDSNATRAAKSATFAYENTGTSPIGYGPGATCGVNGIACFTRSVPGGFTMWLREHGRSFDWGRLLWCQMVDPSPNGCYDAETIALDEFGHVLVLAHHVNFDDDRDYLDAVVQTISRTKPKDGWNEHAYGRCDVATLQREYDTLNTSAKLSTCLDIDTVLSLAASPTSIAYDGTTKLSATLKVAAVDAYDRLKGNNLSGRTVKLQRRPPGATTWTTIATMTVGPTGTYATTISLRSTTEFRAVFTTPADEGLNGDTSPTVRVTVAPCTGVCPLTAGR